MAHGSVFALPPGADFAVQFAQGYHTRFASLDLPRRAKALVLVNTGGALRQIEVALADHARTAGVLPNARLISDLGSDISAVPAMRRQLYLTRLVDQFLANRQTGDLLPPTSTAADLAKALADLMDQFHTQGASPGLLSDIQVSGDAASHWQQALEFVDIVRTAWPRIRAEAEGDAPDIAERQAQAIDAQIADWQANPPDHPVLVVASTGSVGTTARLMAAVADLPMGAVVLPGFDPDIEYEIWENATPDHPMGPFQALFTRLDIVPSDVGHWRATPAPSPRLALITQAMRPAPVTDHWHKAGPQLATQAAAAIRGVDVLEAENPRQEAAAIAVAIRETLAEPDTRVAVITNDAVLARRVATALDRFGIVPDDTMGAPLSQSVPGILTGLTLAAAAVRANTLDIAALLQHPLVQPGLLRSAHLTFARTYERRVLRGPVEAGTLPQDPKAEVDAQAWRVSVDTILAPLRTVLAQPTPLDASVAALTTALSQLTDPGSGPAIWETDGGAELAAYLGDLSRHADVLGAEPVRDLPSLITTLMRGHQLRPRPREVHPRVRIAGTREARTEGAERLILAGLNDGSWPEMPDPGPWLSRPMHQAVGLPLPERAVGLSAHDFQQAVCRGRVLLTRSLRADGAPTVASRWLVRLETLLLGIGAQDVWKQAKTRGKRYETLARRLDDPLQTAPRATRPAPVPPTVAVPRKLPVTQIETLVRDAYAVYARYVLGLRALDPLGRRADMRERGKVLHTIMENFVRATDPWPGPELAHQQLVAVAETTLHAAALPADLRRTWRGRIGRFADWLIETETARRTVASPLGQEKTGELALDVSGERFTLTATVDRIDRMSDGTGAIYDYKSGAPPTEKQIKTGFNQQLHLGAAILEQGGFPDLDPMPAGPGAYIGLTGGREGGRETVLADLPETLPAYQDQLKELLGAYLAGASWLSRGRPERIAFASDYDHLARKAEWASEDER